MGNDPYTLVIAPDLRGSAEGKLFLDEGDGYSYRQGHHQYMLYHFSEGTLRATRVSGGGFNASNTLERVEILGVGAPSKVLLRQPTGDVELVCTHNPERKRLVIRKPEIKMASDEWQIILQ